MSTDSPYIIIDLDGGRVNVRPLMTPEEAGRELERIRARYPFETFQIAAVTSQPLQGLDKIFSILFPRGNNA